MDIDSTDMCYNEIEMYEAGIKLHSLCKAYDRLKEIQQNREWVDVECSQELFEYGVTASEEGIKDAAKNIIDAIKAAFMRFIGFVEKVFATLFDMNQKLTNDMDKLLNDSILSELSAADTEAWAKVVVSTFPPDVVSDGVEAVGAQLLPIITNIGNQVPKVTVKALTNSGYKLDTEKGKYVVDSKFSVARKTVGEFNWTPASLKTNVEDLYRNLKALRKHSGSAKGEYKAAIKKMDNDPEEAKKVFEGSKTTAELYVQLHKLSRHVANQLKTLTKTLPKKKA